MTEATSKFKIGGERIGFRTWRDARQTKSRCDKCANKEKLMKTRKCEEEREATDEDRPSGLVEIACLIFKRTSEGRAGSDALVHVSECGTVISTTAILSHQLSAQGFCGDFLCTTFWSRSLFPSDCELELVETTDPLSKFAPVSWMPSRLSTDSWSRHCFQRLSP